MPLRKSTTQGRPIDATAEDATARGEKSEKGLAAERLDIFSEILKRLSARGMAGALHPANGESREAGAQRFQAEFLAMRFEGNGADFFELLESAQNLVSDWFYGSPCAATGLMRAGFSPMRFDELRHRNNCFNRTSPRAHEYEEVMMAALSQGWNVQTSSDGATAGFASHPITRAIWAWGDDDSKKETFKRVIVALAQASPNYGWDWAWMAIRDVDMASIKNEIKGFMDAAIKSRDERVELEACAAEAHSPKVRGRAL